MATRIFGARNDSLQFHAFFEKFYKNTFFPYLEQHGITNVIQLGDVFDRRKYINFQSLKMCHDYFFGPMVERGITCHMIVGNHDTYYKNTNDVNSPDLLLREYANVIVHNTPSVVEFDDVKFLMVPWICQDNEQVCMHAMATEDVDVVVGHFEITGFEMYRGAVCDEGLDINVFERHPMVLSGHFHHKSNTGNVHYLGTPYEITWSDFNDAKGFHVFDTDTKELSFVANPYTMFRKIYYGDDGQTLEDIVDVDYEQYRDASVKVVVQAKNNPAWFDIFIDNLEKAGVMDVQIVEDHFHLDLETDDDIINEAEDTLTIINKYVDQLQVQGDRQRLDNLIRSLYHEALSSE